MLLEIKGLITPRNRWEKSLNSETEWALVLPADVPDEEQLEVG